MHICIGNLTSIGSDNGLLPGRRQAITWTNAGILLIGLLGTNFSEIWIGIQTFSFKKMHLKMSSGKRRPFCLCLNVLRVVQITWVKSDLFDGFVLQHNAMKNSQLLTICSNRNFTLLNWSNTFLWQVLTRPCDKNVCWVFIMKVWTNTIKLEYLWNQSLHFQGHLFT